MSYVKRMGMAALFIGSALIVGRAAPVAGADAPKEAPKEAPKAAATEPKASVRSVRLTKPWSELTDLTDDQAAKIHAIHEKALAETHEIEKKEKSDCEAVLTDAQKAELKDAMSKDRRDATERRFERRGATTAPTTRPMRK